MTKKSSNNSAAQGIGTFNYRFRDLGYAFIGFRHLSYDFDNSKSGTDRYAVNAEERGPVFGVNFYC